MKNRQGQLESLVLKDHCEMCGVRRRKVRKYLEPAFNPDGQPMTLCRHCRIGSSELIVERWVLAQRASDVLFSVVGLCMAEPEDFRDKVLIGAFEFGGNFVFYGIVGTLMGLFFTPGSGPEGRDPDY
jgi:hypothetical protein